MKKLLHGSGRRTVTPPIALRGTHAAARAHAQQLDAGQAALREAAPGLASQLTTAESISGGVGKSVKQGERAVLAGGVRATHGYGGGVWRTAVLRHVHRHLDGTVCIRALSVVLHTRIGGYQLLVPWYLK